MLLKMIPKMIHPKELNSGNRYFICSLVFTVELKGISARIVILAGFGGNILFKRKKNNWKRNKFVLFGKTIF